MRTDKLTAQGEPPDLLTRMYLRHYAFLRRRYPRQPPRAIYHFATLGLSGLLSSALLALTAAVSLAVSLVLATPVVPWALPNWIFVVGAAAIAFVPGFAIDGRFKNLVDVNRETIYGTVAACFGVLRAWQNS